MIDLKKLNSMFRGSKKSSKTKLPAELKGVLKVFVENFSHKYERADKNIKSLDEAEDRLHRHNKYHHPAKFARELNAIMISKDKFTKEEKRLEKDLLKEVERVLVVVDDDKTRAKVFDFVNELIDNRKIGVVLQDPKIQ